MLRKLQHYIMSDLQFIEEETGIKINILEWLKNRDNSDYRFFKPVFRKWSDMNNDTMNEDLFSDALYAEIEHDFVLDNLDYLSKNEVTKEKLIEITNNWSFSDLMLVVNLNFDVFGMVYDKLGIYSH